MASRNKMGPPWPTTNEGKLSPPPRSSENKKMRERVNG